MKNAYLSWNNQDHIKKLAVSLREYGVSISTTDTVLGFLALASHQSREKLDGIKNRSTKPYLILARSVDDVRAIAHVPDSKNTFQKIWPGPVTVILKAKDAAPGYIKSKENTIAVRIPQHDGLQFLLKEVGLLFSTSANKSGDPVPQTVSDIEPSLLSTIDYIITNDSRSSLSQPSTIIDWTQKTPVMVRSGTFTIAELGLND